MTGVTVCSHRPIWILAFFFFLLASPISSQAAGPSGTIPSEGGESLPGAFQVHSWEKDGLLAAEVAAVLDIPFEKIAPVLTRPAAWCEFVPLVFNIKSCLFERQGGREWLTLFVGRKHYEPPAEALQIRYRFQVETPPASRFRVWLTAAQGPIGTRDYRITLEAEATDDGRTRLRMQSSFRPSLRSRMATEAYLATVARDKVGFSVSGYREGRPVFVSGVKGMIERNVLRYYLALKAHIDTLEVAQERRFEARLHTWYELTAHYPRQLHEMERREYLETKRQERRDQQLLQKRRLRAAAPPV